MTNKSNSKTACLTDADLYFYLTQKGDSGRSTDLEAHFAGCHNCRRALADLIKLLHPEEDLRSEGITEPSKLQLQEMVSLIQNVSGKERTKRGSVSSWFRWPIAAVAAIGFIALSLLGTKLFYEKTKSEAFFAQAKSILDQSYTATSPSNLRLALPFSSISSARNIERRDSFRPAENLLFQALAIRENMVEAHLGLGFIYLSDSEFGRARAEFQKILEIRKGEKQALIGRGVARYEEAIQSSDPLQRTNLLRDALSDFETVLKSDPGSTEARYDKIKTLFESGLHEEALQEIEQYLSQDSGSGWAEELKNLKAKLQATRSGIFEDKLDQAARMRNRSVLAELSRLVPYRIPAAIWSATGRSFQLSQKQVKNGTPSSEDLLWAATTMEVSYSEATGDHSFRSFIDFYVGLSPPARLLKKSLDAEFQNLVKLHENGNFDPVLSRSKRLETRYTQIKDYWQLIDLHHLRGNSLYVGKADFQGAEAEFLKMYGIAKRLTTPEPTLTALAALAMICGLQGKFNDSLNYANSLRILAGKYNLDPWQIYAAMTLGNQYRRLGQSDQALKEYTAALGSACRLSDSIKISEALENSGIVMDREGRFDEAAALYVLAVKQQDIFLKDQTKSQKPEITVRRLNLLLRQGDLALRVGEFAKAEAIFRGCLESANSGMRELEARARTGLAEIHLRTQRLREAETILNQAIVVSESGQYWDTEWKAKFLKGRALEISGRPQEAISLYQQSITVLERMRQNVRTGDLRQSFLNNRFDPFKAVIALLIKSGDKEKALEFVDKAKAATLKEDLTSLQFSRQSPEHVVEGDSPLVEYFFTNEGLLIFFTGQGRVEVSYQGLSSNELSLQIREFLECIKRNDSRKFTEMAQQLYEELISPIEKYVFGREAETLVILPDGPLHLLPFAGLKDGQGRYLIEKTPIAYAPSRTVFQHCLSSAEMDGAAWKRDVLLIDGTNGLPYARDELTYISKLYGRNALSLGAKDLSLFEREVQRSAIVHFSGHAIVQQGKPVLMLQDLPIKVYLDCQTIRNWKCTRARLINLAGCSTGIGPVAEGEAPWGLIPAFLNAGVPAVIASLVPVDDESTKKLNCRFYELLNSGTSKAKALQLAQITLLDSVHQHSDIKPQSWIPYILVGNPR